VKLAPFGVTTLYFGISCSRFYSSVLVQGGGRRPLSFTRLHLLRDLTALRYNRRLLLRLEAAFSAGFPLTVVTNR
jgi:hypothetical protein